MSTSFVLPSGTVTFLFTDIEGSTQLWERQPDAMRAALARHDQILRGVIAQSGGGLFKTVGDSFCVAFATAPQAMCAALEAQRALDREPWEAGLRLRVRMALHTGTAEERDGDYFGPALSRVSRLLAAGHGGQTLVSAATHSLLGDALPPGVALLDLGAHQLRDLGRTEAVYQLTSPDLTDRFPAHELGSPQGARRGRSPADIGHSGARAALAHLRGDAPVEIAGTGSQRMMCGDTRRVKEGAHRGRERTRRCVPTWT